MKASQTRSLCLESDTFLRQQIFENNSMKRESDPRADINDLEDNEEYYENIHLVPVERHEDVDPSPEEFKDFSQSNKHDSHNDTENILTSSNDSNSSKTSCGICGNLYTRRYIAYHLRTHEHLNKKTKLICKLAR